MSTPTPTPSTDPVKNTVKAWTKEEAQKEGVCFISKADGTVVGVYKGREYFCYECHDEKANERVRFYYADGTTTLDWDTVERFTEEVLTAWPTSVPLVKLNGKTYYIPGRMLWALAQK